MEGQRDCFIRDIVDAILFNRGEPPRPINRGMCGYHFTWTVRKPQRVSLGINPQK